MQITLIFVRIISFMLFTVLLLLMPVVTTLPFLFLFFHSFAKMSYVRFVPVGDHLGNALLFHD
jgi:hypothetical protein